MLCTPLEIISDSAAGLACPRVVDSQAIGLPSFIYLLLPLSLGLHPRWVCPGIHWFCMYWLCTTVEICPTHISIHVGDRCYLPCFSELGCQPLRESIFHREWTRRVQVRTNCILLRLFLTWLHSQVIKCHEALQRKDDNVHGIQPVSGKEFGVLEKKCI